MVVENYEYELKELIKILNRIKSLEFSSVNVYGSAFNEEMFVSGNSDIDVIVMCDKFNNLNLSKIIDEIKSLGLNFKEKRPIIIKDSLCERIEFYIVFERIALDITICPGLIPTLESLENDAWYDGFEALMGGVYLNSKCIYGKIPDYDKFLEEYYPFYSDELREKRLNILANRITSYNERIEKYVANKSFELVDHLFKVKKFFIKFLYIYYRKYYWTPEKHSYYQLTNFLDLPEEEKRALCFLDGNIFEAANNYLELSNNYIASYYEEKNKNQPKRKIKGK